MPSSSSPASKACQSTKLALTRAAVKQPAGAHTVKMAKKPNPYEGMTHPDHRGILADALRFCR